MDFPQQLQACVEQANEALRRFIAPEDFSDEAPAQDTEKAEGEAQ